MADLSVPQPPADSEMKTIIDKLANFVARNGPEFEKMTMSKKSDDPKFAFLFGGEYNPYYRWKVEVEKIQAGVISASPSISQPTHHSSAGPIPQDTSSSSTNDSGFIESLNGIKTKEQMDVSTSTPQDPLEVEFNSVVKPVMETCSKEAIASGKGWIFSRSRTPEECGRIAHYMMRRSLDFPGVGFSEKLHLVYLINDLLHHCVRKAADDLQQAIETVIVQIFYNIFSSNPQNVDDLKKVLDIWESQDYLSKMKLEQVRRVLDYPTSKLPPSLPPPPPVVPSTEDIGSTSINIAPPNAPPPWQQQSFTQQQQPGPVPWQQPQAPPPPAPQPYPSWEHAPPPPMPSGPSGPQLPWSHQNAPPPWAQQQPPPPQVPPPQQQQAPPSMVHSTSEPTPLFSPSEPFVPAAGNGKSPLIEKPPDEPPSEEVENEESLLSNKETIDYNHQPMMNPPSSGPGQQVSDFQQSIQVFDYQHRPANWEMGCGPPPPIPPPPHMGGPPFPFSHHQNPPPFYSHPPFPPHDIPPHLHPPHPPPAIPYFDLPAGLMVPLVPLHEHNYSSLVPHLVRLPPPQPPSERLLEAVEEFYYPPSDEKPRNEEGWEAKALLDFYEAKMQAKENMRNRSRDARKSSSHRRRSRSRSHSPKRRRRRSSSSRSRSRSYSPRRRRRSSRSPSSYSSRSRSSSSSSSRSYSPHRRRSRSSRSRSRSLSPSTPTVEDELAKRRSRLAMKSSSQTESIDEENVGHQLLKRMGWEGAGLGARGQGIQEPIKGGETRDKLNQFAGVGINMNDPFEQFRRNKSYTFNRRPPPGSS